MSSGTQGVMTGNTIDSVNFPSTHTGSVYGFYNFIGFNRIANNTYNRVRSLGTGSGTFYGMYCSGTPASGAGLLLITL